MARTDEGLFALLGIPVERWNAGKTGLVLTHHAWRAYFGGDARGVMGVVADDQWNLPGSLDGWLVGELPASTKGFAGGRLRNGATGKNVFRFLRLRDRSRDLLIWMLPMFLVACLTIVLVMAGSRGRSALEGQRAQSHISCGKVRADIADYSSGLAGSGESLRFHVAFFP